MNMNERIKAALGPLGIQVKPDICEGEEAIYCVFNYNTLPCDFADDAPWCERYLVQVHLFGPYKTNLTALRKQVKQLLFDAGFTWPGEMNISNAALERAVEGQHFVYECEVVEGINGETEP